MATTRTDELPTIRIGLLWHSGGSGNLGVGALTVANMAIAESVARECGLAPKFTVLGFRDRARGELFGPEVVQYSIGFRELLSPGGFRRQVAGLDCVLDIGLGDSFTDIYGPRRFSMLWISKAIVAAYRKPLVFSPQTIGPFTGKGYRLLARWAMKRAVAVVSRDRRSLDVARKLAPRAHHVLAADVAFELPFEDRSAQRGGARKKVGLNVSGLLYREAEGGGNRFGLGYDYMAFARNLIADLLAREDVELHLIAHVIDRNNPVDDDAKLADRLAQEFPATVRAPDFVTPSEAKAYISGLDLLVAARMHACIAAFSGGTPVIPVAYSRKFAGLFGMLGFERMVPVTGMDEIAARALVLESLDRGEELQALQAQGSTLARNLLAEYRNELRKVFVGASDT